MNIENYVDNLYNIIFIFRNVNSSIKYFGKHINNIKQSS